MPWNPYKYPDKPSNPFTPMAWTLQAKTLMIWKTKGDNCPACEKLKNRAYPFGYWLATIMPGFHEHCDCSLVPAASWVLESPHDLWGTEPFWWDPTQNVFEFVNNLLNRYWQWLQNRGKGDKYSGFDNLFPVFLSESGITTAGGTMMSKGINSSFMNMIRRWLGLSEDKLTSNYKIRVFGISGVVGTISTFMHPSSNPEVCLPWESYPTQPEPEHEDPYPYWY